MIVLTNKKAHLSQILANFTFQKSMEIFFLLSYTLKMQVFQNSWSMSKTFFFLLVSRNLLHGKCGETQNDSCIHPLLFQQEVSQLLEFYTISALRML